MLDEFTVIQAGAGLECNLAIQPIDSSSPRVEAGDEVSYTLDIKHKFGSNEDARNLVVRNTVKAIFQHFRLAFS